MLPDNRVYATLDHLRGLESAARNLSFLPAQPPSSVLNGRHASRLRGRGLNFEEMRNYLPGDDIRSIDWKATARTGQPHVRVFTEERDRPALLVVDQRVSMFFGTRLNLKSVTAAEVAAIAAFRILNAGDRVGGIVFSDETEVDIVPKRSRQSVMALLQSIARLNGALHAAKPSTATPGSLNRVLGSVARIAHHDHLVIVLSDFDGIDETTRRRLSGIAAHNDLILGLVFDPAAREPGAGRRNVVGDGERQADIDLSSERVAKALVEYSGGRLDRILAWQTSLNLSVLPISAGEETGPQLRRLLGATAPRRRVR